MKRSSPESGLPTVLRGVQPRPPARKAAPGIGHHRAVHVSEPHKPGTGSVSAAAHAAADRDVRAQRVAASMAWCAGRPQ
jgi:hypothetical protein